jgi:YolD-like protein.
MIRDRGKIKWTSMMLPEHVKILREWAAEDQWIPRKVPDEQEHEYMDRVTQEAFAAGRPVEITYYEDGRYKTVVGRLEAIDPFKGRIRLRGRNGETGWISLSLIDRIEPADDGDGM